MALCDRINDDIKRVFVNHEHFASWHTWDNRRFECVVDAEEAQKRKSMAAVDTSWEPNRSDLLIYVEKSQFPGRPVVNSHGMLDGKPMRIIRVDENMGMLTIMMGAFDPKEGIY